MSKEQPTLTVTTSDASETVIVNNNPPAQAKPVKDPLGPKGASNADTP